MVVPGVIPLPPGAAVVPGAILHPPGVQDHRLDPVDQVPDHLVHPAAHLPEADPAPQKAVDEDVSMHLMIVSPGFFREIF